MNSFTTVSKKENGSGSTSYAGRLYGSLWVPLVEYPSLLARIYEEYYPVPFARTEEQWPVWDGMFSLWERIAR
jgi:hypothetical protein